MKRPSKSGANLGKDAARSYYAPADYSLTAEHQDTRPIFTGGRPQPLLHSHSLSHELIEQLSHQSLEARALAEIALAFCRECRGWKNAYNVNDWGYPYISESVTKKLADTGIPPFERHFHYAHLDKVMAAVRDWLASNRIDRARRAAAAKVMQQLVSRYFDGLLDQGDFGRELMAACVEANRRG